MGDFKQAMKWLKEGKKICRPNWKPRTFWVLDVDESIKCNHNKSSVLKTPHIHLEQLKAKDWKVFEKMETLKDIKFRSLLYINGNKLGGENEVKEEFKARAIKRYKHFSKRMENCKRDAEMYLLEGRCQELEDNFDLNPEDLQ